MNEVAKEIIDVLACFTYLEMALNSTHVVSADFIAVHQRQQSSHIFACGFGLEGKAATNWVHHEVRPFE
jgi:hypothetical protein